MFDCSYVAARFMLTTVCVFHVYIPVACVHAIDGTVDILTQNHHMAMNVKSMGPYDSATLFICTIVVALTAVAELKE